MAYVYILENKLANRIKVGATVNHPNDRLTDINRMWKTIKGRCQICLCWRLVKNGCMPNHMLSGKHCTGSGEPPLEFNLDLAERKLKELHEQIFQLSGSSLIAATKRLNNLQKILRTYKENPSRLGEWELRTSYKTSLAYLVEGMTHQILEDYLDKEAPFGEVFSCSTDQAIEAVEMSLIKQGSNS